MWKKKKQILGRAAVHNGQMLVSQLAENFENVNSDKYD